MAFRGDVNEDVDSYISARVAAYRLAELVNVLIAAHSKST